MSRAFRKIIARVLIGILLFTQMAIAAYACPGMLPGAAGVTTPGMSAAVELGVNAVADDPSDQENGMTGCDQMDRDATNPNPNLCLLHCQHGQQTAEHAEVPAVPPALVSGVYVLSPQPVASGPRRDHATEILPAAASPPHTILHCCFRI